MKKSLIALAVLGAFSGAALAQSNVTLYGILDVNYQRIDPETGSATSGINGGHQSGNRFGLRGSEALGGGWNAVFTIEGGFNIDTGTSGQSSAACGGTPVPPPGALNPCGGATQNRLFGRQAWAGLSSGFGTLVAGRIASLSSGTGSFDIYGNVDPFLTGFGDSNLGRAFSSANALRLDNSVLYKSPNFAGFTVGGSYSFNASGSEFAGSGNNVDVIGLGGSWGMGPFYAVVTYDIFDIPGAPDDQTHLQLGGTWDFKIAKLHLGYAIEDETRVGTSVGNVLLPSTVNAPDADAWMAGFTVPLFGGNLLLSYMDRDGDAVTVSPTYVDERDFSTWSIGYTYPLSRRTNLYFNYSDTNGKGTLECFSGTLTTNSNCNPVAGVSTINSGATWDRTMFTIGMRHLF
jgi:predicted porin